MKRQKKISEWLNDIDDIDIKSAAIRNFNDSKSDDCLEDSLSDALLGAFTWEATHEGFDYWHNYRKSLIRKHTKNLKDEGSN